MDIVRVTLTAIFSVVALFIITKILGHKQVAQLDFFDYINGITIGSVAAELATEIEEPYKPFIALCVYGAASVVLNLFTTKIARTRKYINGTPTILLDGGRLYRENLKKAKLDLSEFMILCREAGYFNLDEIQTAVFEHNGKLTVLPRSEYKPLSPRELGISPSPSHIGVELIMDGRVMGENLKRMGRDIRWLEGRIKDEGYGGCEEVFFAVFYPGEDKILIFSGE